MAPPAPPPDGPADRDESAERTERTESTGAEQAADPPGGGAGGEVAWPRRAAVLAADALAFLALLWLGARADLLRRDGVIGEGAAALGLAVAAAGLVALAVLVPRWTGRRRSLPWLVLELVAVGAIVAFPGWVSDHVNLKGGSYLWLAQEWFKIPPNFWLLCRVAPGPFALGVLGTGAAVALAAWRRAGRLRVLLPALGFGAVVALAAGMGSTVRAGGYVLIYGGPWVVAALGYLLARERLASRGSAAGGAQLLLLVFYCGVVPFGHARFEQTAGVRKLYPRPGERTEVAMAFLRTFRIDPVHGRLYTAFGPTSGLISVDLATGDLELIPFDDGMVRHLWTTPEMDRIYALDFVMGEVLVVDKEPFAIVHREDLQEHDRLGEDRRMVPLSFVVGADRMAIVYTEYPGVVELDLADLSVGRSLWFRREGLIEFRGGAWNSVGSIDEGFLVVQLGAVDEGGGFRLVRVDLDSFTVEQTGDLAEGGLAMHRVSETGSVLTAGFFGDVIYEYDERTLLERRRFDGPLNCRRIVHDAARGLLYATSFLDGELWVMRWSDGEVLRRDAVGNRSMSLELDPGGDRLYLGSRDGIFEVDLATYLAGVPGLPAQGIGGAVAPEAPGADAGARAGPAGEG